MAAIFTGREWLVTYELAIPGYPFTLATWFRASLAQPHAALLAWGNFTNLPEYHAITLSADGLHLQADSRKGTDVGEATSGTAFSQGVWTHAAAIFVSATERHIWQNGVRMDGSTRAIPFMGLRCVLGASAQSSGADFVDRFQGELSHAAVYSAALTADEIAALAKRFSPPIVRPHSLLAYWPLGTGSTSGVLWFDRWRDRRNLTGGGIGVAPLVSGEGPFMRARRGRARVALATAAVTAPTLTLIAPVGGVLVWPVRLQWGAFGADRYDVYLGTTPSPPLVSANQIANVFDASTHVSANGSTYYWKIVAKNAIGETTSRVETFTTLQPPGVPSGPRPRDGSTNIPTGSLVTWLPVPLATGYDVYFGRVGEPLAIVSINQPGVIYVPPHTDNLTAYQWQVVARNAVATVSGPVWTFTTTKGPAFPTSFSLEAALGGSFRGQLVSEANNVATWPLSDGVQAGARAHEIHERAVGTWVGSGFTPGVPFESIPEGVLGSTLNGNGFVEVPHMTDPNLSLAGGDIDIAVLLRDVAIDGVERCIVSKQDGGVTGNGYHLSVRSGQIKFYVKIGGAEIVNLTSAFVLGAGERIVTAHYLTQDREAVIAIDGVVDVRVSGLSGAEPQATSAPLRLGAFPGGAANDGASFIGTIAYVAIGREGDWHWGAKLAATRVWTDIWEDVRTLPGPIATRVGIPGSTPSDRVATTGTLTFPLDNSSRRSGRGAYTPGHVGVRRGWKIGIPIRFSIVFEGVRYVEFHGRLAEVRPLPGIHQAQYAECMVTDWMDVAAATPVLAPPIQIDQRSDRVLAAVLAQAQGRTPLSIDLHVGKATFPYALDKGDSEHEMLLTEIGRVVESEGGYLYIRGDTARGGVLRFESQGERDQAPVLVRIGNTMQGLDVSYSLERLVNIVRLSYTPRRVDTTVRPLYQLTTHTEAEPIESGETRVFEGGYVDPANEAESIGGIEMVPLVPDVDYGMNTRADGTGTNLTASLQIFYTLGGNSFRVELTNKSGQDAFLYVTPSVSLQVRGKAVYTYNETTIEKRDPASVRERGPRTLAITLPYDSAPSRIEAYAEYLLALYRQEVPMPSSVTINGNVNATQMRYCLQLQPGDKLALAEPMTGLTLLPTFIVCEKRLSYQAPAFVTVTLTLARARPVQTLTPARVGAMRLNAARLNYLFSLTRGKVVPDALESSLAEQLSR